MVFDDSVKFFGTYRPYQQRALDQIERFLDNQKIHIVAAPGSGKTILGLEIIRKLDQISLVLVPTITIREQWIERFVNCFLKTKEEQDKWISNDLLIKRPIICITYQALYSAYKSMLVKNEIEEDEEVEEYDFSSINLLNILKEYNVKTICLDECHHLKSEWWKALENTINKLEGIKIVALTATPPYDSSYAEWQRYIDLCGPIDEEIFVPELIKDKNLCPHQDYVYFSFPEEDEEKTIMKYYSNALKTYNKYKNHPGLLEVIKSNVIYQNHNEFKKAYYTNSAYYRALIIYLVENKVNVSPLTYILVRTEPLNIKYFEILLQYVLFDDQDSYKKDPLIVSMKKEFSALGIVNKRKVNLIHDERIDKILSTSKSKLKSISEIVRYESAIKTNVMKCLILTDYIKMKTKSIINTEKEITTIGTIPVFEYLRRENIKNVTLCLLSGSICIIPKKCVTRINELQDDDKKFEFSDINGTDYTEVVVKTTNRKKLVSSITELFSQGYFNVIVGTKSLLGEGWDSPIINTLIMASVVGSYVLSNQTRGRAIRINKQDYSKVSNIWHLACLDPYDTKLSGDFENLKKRFSTFVGIDFKNKIIEDGLERLDLTSPPLNRYEAKNKNHEMIKNSINKEQTKKIWEQCINEAKQIEVLTKITYVSRKRCKKTYSFYAALVSSILCFLLYFIAFGYHRAFLKATNHIIVATIILLASLAIISYFFVQHLMHVVKQFTPAAKLRSIGNATLNALKKSKIIHAKTAKVETYYYSFNKIAIYLENASTYEQNIFSECIRQTLDEVIQPRYLLARPLHLWQAEFYIVPDLFKKNKDTVKIFKQEMDKQFGKFSPIFAKNEQGKLKVIHAQYIYYRMFDQTSISEKRVLLRKSKKIRMNKSSLFSISIKEKDE